MDKKQWSEAKYRRTKSWKSQPGYDLELGDMSISSLRALIDIKVKQLNDYKNTHDLSIPEHQREFQDRQQQLKMASDELVHRRMDDDATVSNETRFDPESGLVLNSDGKVLYSIDFNENEDSFIIHKEEYSVTEYYEDDGDIDRKPRTRKEVYKNWDYIKG